MADLSMPSYTGRQWINGRWSHTWQDGTVLPVIRGGDGTADDDDGDQDADNDAGDDDEELSPKAKRLIKAANAEAKRRRLQAREARQRAERAEAKNRGGTSDAGTDIDWGEVGLTLVEKGVPRNKLKMARRLVDLDAVSDADDVIEYLEEEYPDLFEEPKSHTDLPSTGAAHNGPKRNRTGRMVDQFTRRPIKSRYPGLRDVPDEVIRQHGLR